MRRRRSILQTVIIFGGLLGASPMAIAAPQCSSLFETAPISNSDIDSTVADIARMKIEVDTALATGESGTAMIDMNRRLFVQKLDQLENALNGQLTRAEIYKLITQKIALLQKKDATENQAEQKVRDEQAKKTTRKAILTAPKYKRVSKKTVPDSPFFDEKVYYISEINSLLGITYSKNHVRQLTLKDLKTLKETIIAQDFSSHVLSEDRSMIYIFKNDTVQKIDLTGESVGRKVKLKPTKGTYVGNILDISPSGTYLAAKFVDMNANYTESLQIFNLKTGDLEATVPLADKVDRGIGELLFHFTSDSTMTATRKHRDNTDLVEIDFFDESIRAVTTIPTTNRAVFTISENRSQVYFTDLPKNQQSGTALTLKLSGKVVSEQILPGDVQNPHLTTIPYHPNHVFISQARHEDQFGSIVDMQTGQVAFDFDGAYTGKAPSVIRVDTTPDGHLMVYSQELNSSRKVIKRVDVWKKIEEK